MRRLRVRRRRGHSSSRSLALVLATLCTATPLAAQDLDPAIRPTRWRVTTEKLHDDGVDAWLVGAHYDLLDPLPALPGLYVGVGALSAVQGDLGGFFAGGATVGYRRPLGRGFSLDTGVFAGVGGGGRLDFDGFLYRPHVAVQQELGPLDLRVELAYLDLPDADLEDLHVAVGVALPSELLVVRDSVGRRKDLPAEAVTEHRIRVTPTWLHLEPDSDAARRSDGSGLGDIEMAGLCFDYFLTRRLFLAAEVYGATGGDVAGLVVAMAGLGASLPLWSERLKLEAKGLVGSGGGGDVDTGGGFAWQGAGGLALELPAGFALHALLGRMGFPDGSFDATTTALGLSWSVRAAELAWDHPRAELEGERMREQDFRASRTRFEVLHAFHLAHSGARKKDGTPLDDFELVGVGMEVPVFDHFWMTIRGYGAYGGEGGYAQGLAGVRYEVEAGTKSPHSFSVLLETGAAGGGDVDVGSGLIYAASLGYRYRFGERLSLVAEYGRTEADTGPFETDFVQLGLGWSVARPVFR